MVEWTIVLLVIFVVTIVTVTRVVREKAKSDAFHETVTIVGAMMNLVNEILRAWAAYAVTENIEGFPYRIELEWSPNFDHLESVTLVIRRGFQELRYVVDVKDHIAKKGGDYLITGALQFELELI